jgi:hypothetical protein
VEAFVSGRNVECPDFLTEYQLEALQRLAEALEAGGGLGGDDRGA